jgi:hypothetical protein
MDMKKVQIVSPYYLKYNGKTGYIQVTEEITKPFVAVLVNSQAGGKVNRIMEVSNKKFFSDFGGACTELDIKATGFIVN